MNQHTIYIAEDDEDDQFLLRSAFSATDAPCELSFFANGEQLLQHLRQVTARPTMVLLDLNMPIMDGFQTLKHLREQDDYKTMPVVVLTTSSQREDIMRAYSLGANSFITKPHQYAELVQTVQQIQQFWLNLAQLPNPTAQPSAAA